jgi:hypothetical protein
VLQIQRFDFDRILVLTQKINNRESTGFTFKTSIALHIDPVLAYFGRDNSFWGRF